MTTFTAFLYIDTGTAKTHLGAWRNRDEGWVIPCGLIAIPSADAITYAPSRPLCLTCIKRTESSVTSTPSQKSDR